MRGLLRRAAVVLATAVGVALGSFGVAQAQQSQPAVVRDNSDNSIVRGGTLSAQEFVDKARANSPNDLQAIFSAYGLTPDEYDRFLRDAKMGVASKDGTITVDGRVVARNAYSLGRDAKSYSTPKTINGVQYHESRAQDVFVPRTMQVLVLMDAQGRMEFAVLAPCGNPVRATVVQPQAPAPAPAPAPTPTPVAPKPVSAVHRCANLRAVQNSANRMLYTFTATASHRNAQVSYADFDFGDGTVAKGVRPGAAMQTAGSTTNNSTGSTTITSTPIAVDHTYAQAGTYTATATVYFTKTEANGTTASYSDSCQATVTPQMAAVQPVAAPQAPAVLPATGVGEFVALFLGVTAFTSAGYYLYTKRRLLQS